jgi:hypothetical protein
MGLDEYPQPKGAYYTPALIATFADEGAASDAVASLRAAGFMPRDIGVARKDDGVTIVVSEPTAGMLEQARGLLAASAARDVRPYGADADQVS